MECRHNTGKDGIHTLFTLQGPGVIRESYFWPLIIWIPVTILTLILRHCYGICSVPHPHSPSNIVDQAVDSFASYFQFPRSATNTLDTVERILGIPMLGTAFIAIRSEFERVK